MSLASSSASKPGDVDGIPGRGSVIADKYRIERKLGQGGMGVVVAARHLQLNQLVAIKFLHPNADARGVVTARFLREARASAALRSEHVARVYDVGTLESGAPYMVMEHLEGISLSKLIRTRAPLPIREAVDMMIQACKGMEEAHSLGIVHRDIKPGNLFLSKRPDGSPILKVLDFGISKAPKLDDEPLTASQMVLGSPKYFSPEQVRDAKYVDHRADVWALGLVLYYMLAGRRPFEGDTMSSVCVAIATETPPRLADLRPEVPRELDAVVMKCLEKERENRVQSAAELERLITPFGSLGGAAHVDPVGINPILADAIPSAPGSAPGMSRVSHPDLLSAPLGFDPPRLPAAGAAQQQLAEETRSVALAVNAQQRKTSMVWLQVGAAVVVAAGLVLVLVGRGPAETAPAIGSVGPALTPTAKSSAPAAPSAPPPTNPVVRPRTNFLPGSAKPVTPTRPSTVPDISKLVGSNTVATTKTTLRLLDRVGGQQVVGVVPKGDVVVINKWLGEWAMVTYVDKGHAITGWTIRNLIE